MAKNLNIRDWKEMLISNLTDDSCPDEVLEWVSQCALHAFEQGDVDDDVAQILLRWEGEW